MHFATKMSIMTQHCKLQQMVEKQPFFIRIASVIPSFLQVETRELWRERGAVIMAVRRLKMTQVRRVEGYLFFQAWMTVVQRRGAGSWNLGASSVQVNRILMDVFEETADTSTPLKGWGCLCMLLWGRLWVQMSLRQNSSRERLLSIIVI